MSSRLSALKIAGIAVAGIVVALVLFVWLALPGLIQSQAQKFIAEKTGHKLTLDKPRIALGELSVRIGPLRLEDSAGKPLLAFRELLVDISASSLTRRAFVFDAIRLDQPEVAVALLKEGRLNWSALLDALKDKEEKPASPLPRFDIDKFSLVGGRIDFADEKHGFATRIDPLELELTDISTLPDDTGRYKVSANTALGARVHWHGEVRLKPVSASGSLAVEGLDLARLAPYLKDALPIAPPAGVAGAAVEYQVSYEAGKVAVRLDKVAAKVDELRVALGVASSPAVAVKAIEAANGAFVLADNKATLESVTLTGVDVTLPRAGGTALKPFQLGSLAVTGIEVDLAARNLALGKVALKSGQIRATRDAQGRIDVLDALQSLKSPATAGKPAPASAPGKKASAAVAAKPTAAPDAGKPWRYRVGAVDLAGFSAALRDETVSPAAELALDDIALGVEGVSENLAAALPVRTAFRVRSGGGFEAAGRVVPAEPAAEIKFKLAELALKAAQPYLAPFAKLTLASGSIGAEGRVAYGKKGAVFKGGFTLRDLRLNESGTDALFLSLKSFGTRELEATPSRLDIGELVLDGLDTQLLIARDKSVNVTRILRKPETAAAPGDAPAAAPATAEPEKKAAAFAVAIERLRVANSEMDFADESLAFPFATRVHQLRGVIVGLSSQPGPPAQIELDGHVDDYGLARAVGQIDLFKPTEFTDMKVVFRNVEMTRLTPYSATFAGRRIDSGKLSLDLEYKIKKRQIAGDNQIVMDQLTLGERVESASAKDLPLDLALAILRDSDGRIDLGLPVSGSLDDPQFSYGSIVWKAIVNVVSKIATAPFRALASLFGSGDKVESLAFEPGDAQLTPPEREKLARIAGALKKRPGLALTLHGVHAEADRVAIQDRQLRRAIAERTGQRVEAQDDPGPVSLRAPKVQSALESLYADRLGGGELAALKEGFRKANPGQLEEGVAGKMMSRLSGLLREQRTLNEQEVGELKGADFPSVLYQRLREREKVADAQLQALARARGEHLLAVLKAGGAPMERIAAGAVERVESEGRDVPAKLVLGTAK